MTDQAKQLINAMLVMDPDKRMTAEEALNSPWIRVSGEERWGEREENKEERRGDMDRN